MQIEIKLPGEDKDIELFLSNDFARIPEIIPYRLLEITADKKKRHYLPTDQIIVNTGPKTAGKLVLDWSEDRAISVEELKGILSFLLQRKDSVKPTDHQITENLLRGNINDFKNNPIYRGRKFLPN